MMNMMIMNMIMIMVMINADDDHPLKRSIQSGFRMMILLMNVEFVNLSVSVRDKFQI